MSPTPKVRVGGLRKAYAGLAAVSGIDFTIAPGEIFGLLGPNGAGKTTTLECLVGLRHPDEGELEICGVDARRHPHEVKQKIGVVLQTTSLQDKITPREALTLFAAFYRQSTPAADLLARFGLVEKADVPVERLSGGQRQRLALALAFVNRPELVFLDEPTTGLDPQSRRELHELILALRRDGHTVLFTTHHLEEAEKLCDRVAIIDRGRIVATGAPRDLVAASREEQSVTIRTSPPLGADVFAALPGLTPVVVDGDTVRFQTKDATATLAALTARLREQRVEIRELTVRKASLEDLFLALTREGEP
ncbi:MAG: ABC transporter ATP-binding protein [Verrucomicrobia bacterium]|nr:ABC transporter ATP-binding protein [Verrucomicrobiota bacterium]